MLARGAREPVEVLRDGRGVPHVFATSEADAWLGLGVVHAQDRLAQMERSRRAARGTLAAVEGERALPGDRLARTLGFVRRAERDLAALRASERRALEAYAAGVNAHLVVLGSGETQPPRALRAIPEPWHPVDSLAIWKHYAWALGGTLEESLVLTTLLRRYGGLGARLFFPEGVGLEALSPRGSGSRAGTPARSPVFSHWGRAASDPGPVAQAAALRMRGPLAAPLRAAAGLAGRSVGSSAFAVRTREGRALLAGDVHAAPTAPALLHQAHVSGGRLDAAGVALPGVPGFWSGFNGRIAWSATHLPVLVTDLVLESNDPGLALEREEQIEVRGGDTETLIVRETRRGPLVHGLLEGDAPPQSVRWTGAEPGVGPAGLLALARARSVAQAREALARHVEPVLLVVIVDRGGGGGSQVAGYLPAREVPSGGVAVPAADGAYLWSAKVPAAALPRANLSARRRLVIAADGPPPGRRSGAIEWLWRPGRREARIRERVAAGVTEPRDLIAVQSDVVSPGATELVALALSLVRPVEDMPFETRQAVEILRSWDGRSTPTSVGAVAYHVFLTKLIERLFEPTLGEDLLRRYLALRGVAPQSLARGALEEVSEGGEPKAPWSEAAFVSEAVERSLRDVWITSSVRMGANRAKWTWGRLHRLSFAPLSPGAWRGGPADALGPWPYGGDDGSVQVAEYAVGGFDAAVVAGFRMVVDGGDLDQAHTTLAPGPSEHPGHPDATSGIADWREGRPRLLSRSRPVVEDGPMTRLRLEPAPVAESGSSEGDSPGGALRPSGEAAP